ncbi:transcriptional regulator, HxlR family [Nocardioides sp. YR527]|uniref:winged helix-turn-helix transcriptional regulator n=1 Tax=Nocardioides sp. YR527 TaxID=1881028 RepID=UPI0008900198|nr:helix-turn-helix domain-containing protein [Nocardioides sp. YR527]SDK28193.1 transcriptional regulator, HxlR family [Nocardioides sp. YR527]
MLGKTYDGQICSIARSLEIVGERWTLLILRDAIFAGVTRYGDFQHNLGIATNILKTRLATLVETGLMTRDDAGDYRPTAMAQGLRPALIALTEWGDTWFAPDGRPIDYLHADCGEPVTVETRCQQHGTIPPDDVVVRPGPGMPAEYLAARRPTRDR